MELTFATALLLFVSLWALRTNLQTIRPRNWAMIQAITDAYMTEHLAYAEAIEYEKLLGPDPNLALGIDDPSVSYWPAYPANHTRDVTVGTLPSGLVVTGTLIQTRQPDINNISSSSETTGTPLTNPAQVESWLVQSHLTYTIAGREYVKSRNTVRTR